MGNTRAKLLMLMLGMFAIQAQGSSHVLLNADNFKELVSSGDTVWAIEFHSSRCGSCAEFKPTWQAAARKLENAGVQIGQVEIEKPGGLQLAQKLGALDDGLPGVKIFTGQNNPITLDTKNENNFLAQLQEFLGGASSFKKNGHGHLLKLPNSKDDDDDDDDDLLGDDDHDDIFDEDEADTEKGSSKQCKSLKKSFEKQLADLEKKMNKKISKLTKHIKKLKKRLATL